MMVLRSVTVALSYVAGIVAATLLRTVIPAPVLLLLMLPGVAATVRLCRDERRWVTYPRCVTVLAVVLVGLPLGYWRTMQRVGPPRPGSLRAVLQSTPEDTPIMLRGSVAAEPDVRDECKLDLHVRVAQVSLDGGEWQTVIPDKVLLRVTRTARAGVEQVDAMDRLMDLEAYGYLIEVETRCDPARKALNPHEFSFARFLEQHGLVAWLKAGIGNVRIVEESRGNLFVELALAAKRRFLGVYRHAIRSPASLLTAAATLGTRRAVEKREFRGRDIAKMFRHAGVGHVLAVSGLHVTVISLLLYFLFEFTGLRPRVFVPPLILFLLVFALLTGARPSSMRAVIMNAVILAAFAYFRFDLRRATYIGLALASLVILLVSPLILYSPGFLLSFGAVLSLVLITPTLDRWLCRLRGFSLLFATVWFTLVLTLGAFHLSFFLNPLNVIGTAGLLWCLVLLGGRLNEQRPRAWRIGLDRLPAALRLLISAQFSIQLGMMIPMSAWFFGQLPVAGVLVNLIAIPAIAVLVQLGMLTGLLGLVPVLGRYLAAPFGASATLAADFFYWLAYAGAEIFPFPATPKPSPTWLVAYYLVLAGLLSIESWRIRVQSVLYRWWPGVAAAKRRALAIICAVPVLMAMLPLAGLRPVPTSCKRVTCLAQGRFPIVTLAGTRGKLALINAGDRYGGERVVFDVIRGQGAAAVDTAVLAGPHPAAGNWGLAALLGKMDVRRCLVPLVASETETYLKTVGDDYLRDKARKGEYWAADYDRAYAALVEALDSKGVPLLRMRAGELLEWDNLRLSVLRPLSKMPERFVSSAKTALLGVDFGGYRWLIVTETTVDAIDAAVPRGESGYDVLVLPAPNRPEFHRPIVDAAVEAATPRVVIVTGDRVSRAFDIERWARDTGTFELFVTARDGAVTGDLTTDGRLRLRGFASGRTTVLAPSGE